MIDGTTTSSNNTGANRDFMTAKGFSITADGAQACNSGSNVCFDNIEIYSGYEYAIPINAGNIV